MKTAVTVVLLAVLAGCSLQLPDDVAGDDGTADLGDPGGCVRVDMAVSSEKIDLLTELAGEFNRSDAARLDGGCAFVQPHQVASGAAAAALAEGWDEQRLGVPPPVIWSPASAAWGAVTNQRISNAGGQPIVPAGTPFMLSPLVIAMPQPMADALGHPEERIGWSDILELAQSEEGWAAFGHPEWGAFRLGKTNPNFSTSGLSALIAQYYAAAGSPDELTGEAVRDPQVIEFAETIESAVVHYGDTTLTFLNNWYRHDRRGTALTYASAVAVEEVSLINYNRGNPDGVLEPGEEIVPPRIPLVAIYPEEGTLFSDNPFFVLDTEWVSEEARTGAAAFTEFVQQPANQQRVLEFGFRPGNIEVPIADPIVPANGVDPDQPTTTLEVPEPPVVIELLDTWAQTRKPARVQLVLDVSGSMGDLVDGTRTKLDLAREAALGALDQFKDDDIVGLRIFSTDLGADPQTGEPLDYVDIVQPGPMTEVADDLRSALQGLFPVRGTPLYTVTRDTYSDAVEAYDAERINAIVLLTDGVNDDPRNDDFPGLIAFLEEAAGGENTQPVRIFTIGYGGDADHRTLSQISELTSASYYDSSNPQAINDVFTAVISNF